MNGAEDMVVDHDMIVIQLFGRLGKRFGRPCIPANFGLRINRARFQLRSNSLWIGKWRLKMKVP